MHSSVVSASVTASVAVVAVVGALLALPAVAGEVGGDAEQVVLTGVGAEANDVFVNWGNNPSAQLTIRDYAGVSVVGGPCVEASWAADMVECPPSMRPRVVLRLGAGDDEASSGNLNATGTTTVMYGGPGRDELQSGAGTDRLHGGPGNDTLVPDGDSPAPGDIVSGGPGVDLLDLRPVVASTLRASLDGVANDGRPGDRDNYRADIENINGSNVARNTLVGNARRNVLAGGDLGDVLVGGAGRDELDGRGGNDTLNALDGRGGDRISCGSGADVAYLDPGDVAARDCERRFHAARVQPLRALQQGRVVRMRLACPKAATGPCRGVVRLQRGKQTLLQRSYAVRAGRSAVVTLRTTARGRAVLRGSGRVKARLLVSARKAAVPAGRMVSVRRG